MSIGSIAGFSSCFCRLARVVGADAILGAVCGALYGTVFGGFGPLVRDETLRILWVAGGCAVLGLVIGACGSEWGRLKKESAEGPESLNGRDVNSAKSWPTATAPHQQTPREIQSPTFTAG